MAALQLCGPQGLEMTVEIDARPRAFPVRVSIATDVRLYREGLAIVLRSPRRTGGCRRSRKRPGGCCSRPCASPRRRACGYRDARRDHGDTRDRVTLTRRGHRARRSGTRAGRDRLYRGGAGYITRDGALADLAGVIHSVLRGEILCSPRMVALLLRRLANLAAESPVAVSEADLTAREREIVELIHVGLSNQEIAARLSIGFPQSRTTSTTSSRNAEFTAELRLRRA